MTVLGLDSSKTFELEREERKTLLNNGTLVCSSVTTEFISGFDSPVRNERRIVKCGFRRFFLIYLISFPRTEPSGRWRIYGREDDGLGGYRGKLRRYATSAENAREDEEAEREFVYKGLYSEPEIQWITESPWQMTHLERKIVALWKKKEK